MPSQDLEEIANALVADCKGILAADETIGTLTKRFEKLKIRSIPESRRDYRELLFTTPGAAEFISGVIMYDETIRQDSCGRPLRDILVRQRVIPGIKVDMGAKPLAGSEGETITEGLDDLRNRLKEYRAMGAKFAKWRTVLRITDRLPSQMCISANAHALGRYASLCQEQDIVPVVEPEVLIDGAHTIERCEEVTSDVLHAVFHALYENGVALEGMLLKPSMVISGSLCQVQASDTEVAEATLRCLRRHVPAAVPGVVFLSGGQSDVAATKHLNAINQIPRSAPWKISFSYGRALQDQALATWLGEKEHYQKAQRAYYRRANCNAAAAAGRYDATMERELIRESDWADQSGYEDD